MKKYADILLESLVNKDPYSLPLAPRYKATFNGIAGALHMMGAWAIVQKVNRVGQYLIDEPGQSVFVTASVNVSDRESLFWGRVKVENELVTELEIFLVHSRAEGGFVFYPEEIGKLPKGWAEPVPAGMAASREELLQLGKAIFNMNLEGPPPAEYSILMEQGGVVHEDPDYLSLLSTGEMSDLPVGSTPGTMEGMGLFPFRPHDDFARVLLIDEEQGVVVSCATVYGYVSEHVTRAGGAQSAFVPDAMMENHLKTVIPKWMEGRTVMTQMRAACISTQLFRLHSGRIQGMQMFNYVVPVAGDAVWSGAPIK